MLKRSIDMVPYLRAVHAEVVRRTRAGDLLEDFEAFAAQIAEQAPCATLEQANLDHAIAITLLSAGMTGGRVGQVLKTDLSDNPEALATILLTTVVELFYPDGKGVHRGEWSRNVQLVECARGICGNLRLECLGGLLRERANTKEARTKRGVTTDDPADSEVLNEVLAWMDLMSSLDAQVIVIVGLAKVPAERVPWALMALIRYTADGRDYKTRPQHLRDVVALVAQIETRNK